MACHTFMGTTCWLFITISARSLLKKKGSYVFYHAICESVVMGESLTGNAGTNRNCADLATKVLYGGNSRFHVSNLLYDIY